MNNFGINMEVNRMKRVIEKVIKLMIVLVILASGFGGLSAAKAEENYKIGFSTKMYSGNAFWVALVDAVEDGIHAGDEYVMYDAQQDIQKQIQHIEDLIANEFDAIIVSASDSEALNPVLKKANENGIKVIIVDSGVSDDTVYETAIMNDNIEAANKIVEFLDDKLNGEGKVITYYDTLTDQSLQKGRTVQEGMQELGYEVVHVDGVGTVDEAITKLEAAVQANPDVKAIHCLNGPSGDGAISALLSAGILDQVLVTSIDASKADIENIKNGRLAAAGTQKPNEMGSYAVEAAYKALKGEELDKVTTVPADIITEENVDSYEPLF